MSNNKMHCVFIDHTVCIYHSHLSSGSRYLVNATFMSSCNVAKRTNSSSAIIQLIKLKYIICHI